MISCNTFLCFLTGKDEVEPQAQKNIAFFPAHRVTKINLMRAAAEFFFGKYVEINSEFYYFFGHDRQDKHVSNNQRPMQCNVIKSVKYSMKINEPDRSKLS